MSLSKGKKRIILIIALIIAVLAVSAVVLYFAASWVFTLLGLPQDMVRCGKYTGYDAVVVAPDTDDAVLDELDSYHIPYVEYKKGRVLFGDGGLIDSSDIHKEPKIYLCKGKYDAQLGDFISYDGKYPITVCGEDSKTTVISGGSRLYENNGAAVFIKGKKSNTLKKSKIKNLTVDSFDYGVKLEYADKTEIDNVVFLNNHSCGLLFENTSGCRIDKCTLEENGNPKTSDTGYGITLLYNSKNNTVNADYINNGNGNAVDFADRIYSDLPTDNTFKLNKSFNLSGETVPVRDSKEEAQNAKPTSGSIRYELENATIDNVGAVLSNNTQNVKPFSGSGWVFLFNTKISLDINVQEAGNYRIYVVGTSDDGNNKCDYFQVNGGTKYLTSYLGKQKGEWQISQPGTEFWENDELHPVALTNGFELKAGKNTIDITANWGYCAYDSIIIEKINQEAKK